MAGGYLHHCRYCYRDFKHNTWRLHNNTMDCVGFLVYPYHNLYGDKDDSNLLGAQEIGHVGSNFNLPILTFFFYSPSYSYHSIICNT